MVKLSTHNYNKPQNKLGGILQVNTQSIIALGLDLEVLKRKLIMKFWKV